MSSKSYKRRTSRNPYIQETNLNNDVSKRTEERPKNCVLTTKKQPKLLSSNVKRNNQIINKLTEYPVPMEIDDPTEYSSWDPMDLD